MEEQDVLGRIHILWEGEKKKSVCKDVFLITLVFIPTRILVELSIDEL